MSERKVLNKYYAPDFDPATLPKLHFSRDRQYVVRLMAPFTMRCLTCGNHVYKGRKFNARKETVRGETYLGLPIFRFYIRCPVCLSEITFKTDPENTDYAAENGAYRTFQAENIAQKDVERKQQEKDDEEANNPMFALENRTKESRREMDILDVLEEIKDLNSQHEGVSFEELIGKHFDEERKEMDSEDQIDEAVAKAIYQSKKHEIKRLKDNDDSELVPLPKKKPTCQKIRQDSQSKGILVSNLVSTNASKKLTSDSIQFTSKLTSLDLISNYSDTD